MSYHAENVVWACARDLTLGQRMVLLCMADLANAENGHRIRAKQRSIAERTGMRREVVGRAIRRLVALGWLELVDDPDGLTHTYRFVIDHPAAAGFDPRSRRWITTTDDADQGAAAAADEGVTDDHNPVTDDHTPCDPGSHQERGAEKTPENTLADGRLFAADTGSTHKREKVEKPKATRWAEWLEAYPKLHGTDAKAARFYRALVSSREATEDELAAAARNYARAMTDKPDRYIRSALSFLHPNDSEWRGWVDGNPMEPDPAEDRAAHARHNMALSKRWD